MNIFIDGTWNTPKDSSNITRLHKKMGGHYFPGPGTKEFFLDRILGGAFGFGTEALADKAYNCYVKEYGGGPVNIFGFSRGATAARRAAFKIASKGGKVSFLGCFDTVGALGVPLSFWPFTFYDDIFIDTKIHPNIQRVAHALATDEHRNSFQNAPMTPRQGVIQKGFKGDHWYVGCSDETLEWMESALG